MPLKPSDPNSELIYSCIYTLPTKEELKTYFGTTLDGELNFFNQTELLVQLYLYDKHHIKMPDDEIMRDKNISDSPAYETLAYNFHEIIKNSIDAEASTLTLMIFKNDIDNNIEIILADKQASKGFRAGQFKEFFADENSSIDYQVIMKRKDELQITSTKEPGKTMGGRGLGLAILSNSLKNANGMLTLQSTNEYPAIIRLSSTLNNPRSKLGININSDNTTVMFDELSQASDTESNLSTSSSPEMDIVSPVSKRKGFKGIKIKIAEDNPSPDTIQKISSPTSPGLFSSFHSKKSLDDDQTPTNKNNKKGL